MFSPTPSCSRFVPVLALGCSRPSLLQYEDCENEDDREQHNREGEDPSGITPERKIAGRGIRNPRRTYRRPVWRVVDWLRVETMYVLAVESKDTATQIAF